MELLINLINLVAAIIALLTAITEYKKHCFALLNYNIKE